MVMHEKAGTSSQPPKKSTNGPQTDTTMQAPGFGGMSQGGKKELTKDELRALFKAYDAADAELKEAVARILDAKRKRSKIVEKISEGSPKTKTFRFADKGGQVFTIMSREDKNEKSPSYQERFYYFRTPGIPDPLDL